jgi:glutaredoxin
MKPNQVRLFIKPFCSWCDRASRWLDAHGVVYDIIDVYADEVAFDEMVELSGQDLAPVIQVDGQILADFGPDELDEWWHKQRFHKE